MLTETQMTDTVCECFRRMNGRVIKYVGGSGWQGRDARTGKDRYAAQEPGLPDRFIAHSGICGGMFAEFKKENAKATTKQRFVLEELAQRGTNALIIRCFEHNDNSGITVEFCDYNDTRLTVAVLPVKSAARVMSYHARLILDAAKQACHIQQETEKKRRAAKIRIEELSDARSIVKGN